MLEFDEMRDLPLDRIDEAAIERLKFWALSKVGKTTVHRYLATLRRALRYAWRKLKIIDRAPVIEQYENERQVEYVFDANSYQQWIEKAEEPLRSASILARNSGITQVEMLNLEKDCVLIRKRPDEDGNWGDLVIKRGLKRRARKRVLKINAEAKEVLEQLVMESEGRHVFSQPRHPDKKLEPWVLESQMGRLRDKIKTDPDAGLHTLRHTFLTEAGQYTEAFTLQYIAGHDTIKTTMRYVHPRSGVSQPGVRSDQSEEEGGAVRIAADAKGAYKNAYSRLGGKLKRFV